MAIVVQDPRELVSDNDVAFFKENGFWVGPRILTDDDLASLPDEAERVFAGERDDANWGWRYDAEKPAYQAHSPSLRDYSNAWWVNRGLRERVVLSRVLGGIASRLMGVDEVRVWHDQLFWKGGAAEGAPLASNIGWHQDGAYWRMCSRENDMLTGWVALRETSVENGCVQAIAGSHLWGLIPESATFERQDLEGLRRQFEAPGREWREVPMPLKAGQVSFHHSRTLHGSGPNRTPMPRLGIAVSMMPGGNRYLGGTQYHQNVRLLGPIQQDDVPFDGPCWPAIWGATVQERSHEQPFA